MQEVKSVVIVKEVKTRKDLKKFVKFGIDLYKDSKEYVPVLIMDEMNEFIPEKNDAYSYCESRQFLAYRDGAIVGRIAGISNRLHNEKVGRKQMRFTRFDMIDDYSVTEELFKVIRQYAKELDCEEIIGPIGFCDLDKQGLLIEGFDRLGMYITPYNYSYYMTHLEKIGFQKAVDWVEYRIELPQQTDPRRQKIAEYVMERYQYTVRRLTSGKEVMELFPEAIKIMNEVYMHLFGYVSLTDRQIHQFSSMIKPLINPEFVCVVENKNKEIIGYGFVAPSVSLAFQKSRGHLNIRTIFRLMRALKHNDTIDLYSVGVKHQYQNTGVNAIIMNEILNSCLKHGIKYAETGPELEYNHQVQDQWKDLPRELHKKRRCYSLFIK